MSKSTRIKKSVLDEILRKVRMTEDAFQKRKDVLEILKTHFITFLHDLCYQQAVDGHVIVPDISFKILPYGSFGIGTMDADSDLDVIITCYQHRCLDITRDSFFKGFYGVLQEDYRVTKLCILTSSPSYQIKFRLLSVDVDLVFAITEGGELLGYAPADRQAISALKICNWFKTRFGTARSTVLKALRIVKFWGKCVGIYGTVYGFLPGIAWTILVTKIWLKYPRMNYVGLVSKFFEEYAKWNWNMPITLFAPKKDFIPAKSVMSIFTPSVFPKNTANRVSNSALKIITGHINRELHSDQPLMDLDKFSSFPESYFGYLRLMASTMNQDPDQAWLWMMHVRGKLNSLRNDLEFLGIHPRTKVEEVNVRVSTEREAKEFAEQDITLNDIKPGGSIIVYSYIFYLGIMSNGEDDITKELEKFFMICEEYDKYNDKTHLISARLVEKIDL